MAKNITGNQDGENGENETYRIPGRSASIPRKKLVREVKAGNHPDHSVYTLNDKEYIRAKPDNSECNNVNKDK